MSSIHTQRAKRWETNPWVAEWFANAFEYCHNTPEGKRAFEAWSVQATLSYALVVDHTNLQGLFRNLDLSKAGKRFVLAKVALARNWERLQAMRCYGTHLGSVFS